MKIKDVHWFLLKIKVVLKFILIRNQAKLLGAELFCSQAEHLGHLLAWTIDADQDIHQILAKPFYHPTLEEGLRSALKHARRQFDAL